MILIALLLSILGLVVVLLTASIPRAPSLRIVPWIFWGAAALAALSSLAKIVPPGYTGVQVLFGRVLETPLSSGLHLLNPFVGVELLEVRTRNYTMSSVADEGQKRGDDSIAVITADGLTVKLDATILYSLQEARCPEIFKNIGMDVEERIVRGEIRTALRDAAASLSATELYTVKREAFVAQISETLKAAFEKRGILLEQVLLRNVVLPEQITRAINEKIAADQESQKMIFVLQRERQEADRKRIEAEGQAKAQQIVSQSLTPQILEYQRIQALREIGAKGNMIITGGGTPLIEVPAKR
jgi:regulator of protease activity HflC (stomatin/prohibitin superfamily)